MTKTLILTLVLTATSLSLLPGCATRQPVRAGDELEATLQSIPVGESHTIEVVGTLRPYSGSNPKGQALTEIAVGNTALLVHPTANRNYDNRHLNKEISARIEISHFPMPDSNPASQIAGTWITSIKNVRIMDAATD
jgi:hypothetical protein